jgi:hypothetical protein
MKSLPLRILTCAGTAAVTLASGCRLGPGSDLVTVLFTNPGTTGYQATAFDSAAPTRFNVTAHLSPGATFCARTHTAAVGNRATINLEALPDSGGFVFKTSFHLDPGSCSQCSGSPQVWTLGAPTSWTWDGRSLQAGGGNGWC